MGGAGTLAATLDLIEMLDWPRAVPDHHHHRRAGRGQGAGPGLTVAASFSVLARNRDFRRLFAAELVVFGADWFVMVPLLVLLPKLTGSGVWGAFVLAADTGINALLLPYAGTVADRLDRRKILIIANVAALLCVLLLFAVRSAATAPLALVAVGAMAVAKAFYSPAATAALPNVVDADDLAAANAISGSAWGTMTVVGASLGGVVSGAFGPDASFAITVACLLIAATLTALIRRPLQVARADVAAQRAWPALVEALRYLRGHPRIRALVTVKSAVGLGNGVTEKDLIVHDERPSIVEAQGVDHRKPADTISYQASTFVLASGYTWSPHLLLLSTSPRYPNGVANSSGLVGRARRR